MSEISMRDAVGEARIDAARSTESADGGFQGPSGT